MMLSSRGLARIRFLPRKGGRMQKRRVQNHNDRYVIFYEFDGDTSESSPAQHGDETDDD